MQPSCSPHVRSASTLGRYPNLVTLQHFFKTVHTCWYMQDQLPWGGKGNCRKRRSRKDWVHTSTQNLKFRDLSAMLWWLERDVGQWEPHHPVSTGPLTSKETPAASQTEKIWSLLWMQRSLLHTICMRQFVSSAVFWHLEPLSHCPLPSTLLNI